MPRPKRWHQMVISSREEALNAVEFYNRPGGRRSLESFLVHMHIAWLYLLHAEFERDGVNYKYRDPQRPTRYLRVDGEPKTWELEKCVKERWSSAADPVRLNLETTIRLRNRIEHRHQAGMAVAGAGFVQSLLMNYEDELVSQFGPRPYSIADVVHIPVSLSTFSREGLARLSAAQMSLPRRLQDFFIQSRVGLDDSVLNDPRFEFRIEILQKRSPKSEADMAVTFVREDELDAEQLAAYRELEKTGRVIIREKDRHVANLNLMKPSVAAREIQARLPYRFSVYSHFSRAWKHFDARPVTSAKGPKRKATKKELCVYDSAHDDYLYTDAFVELVSRECTTPEGFKVVTGMDPEPIELHSDDTQASSASSRVRE